MTSNQIRFLGTTNPNNPVWQGDLNTIAFESEKIKTKLLNLAKPCYFIRRQGQIGVTNDGELVDQDNHNTSKLETLTAIAPLVPQQLGERNFLNSHQVKYAYAAGSMANGIASEELVIALGKEHVLSSFGAAGLLPPRIEKAIYRIQQALSNKPYAFNLIHSPSEVAIERKTVDLYLQHGVTTIEASAFLDLTPNVVYYRAAGLSLNSDGCIEIKHKIIAKISRREVARKFLQPAPDKILQQLVSQGLITELQAKLASQVPMADDITVEADSGGHTDNRPLVCLLPAIMMLRDQIQAKYSYATPVRVGAAGGISTPQSALAAFMMGAAYVVTGSVNQACLEAGTSTHTKNLLAQAATTDVIMAPAGDMFEMGVKVQVLKRGTFFGMRSQKLAEIYQKYSSIEDIPKIEQDKLERQIFQKTLVEVWQDTVDYFNQRDPAEIERAANNPKRKMALIFRWYLGLSSRWSITGEPKRVMDYQIWCGAAMGAFNSWVQDSYLAEPRNRKVVDVANQIMTGAAYLYRLQNLKLQNIYLSDIDYQYLPKK
ncbi:MAG: PfaD family polyunsaturated fatty acid/polyketide biosynthesis protein [Cyanobacteria bacterium J06600_6]